MPDLPPLLSAEATGSAHRLEKLKCSLQLLINLRKNCRFTNIRAFLGFRKKSILAGGLIATHPVSNSKVLNSSGLKFMELFVKFSSTLLYALHT
jgi:hypothetical protein